MNWERIIQVLPLLSPVLVIVGGAISFILSRRRRTYDELEVFTKSALLWVKELREERATLLKRIAELKGEQIKAERRAEEFALLLYRLALGYYELRNQIKALGRRPSWKPRGRLRKYVNELFNGENDENAL